MIGNNYLCLREFPLNGHAVVVDSSFSSWARIFSANSNYRVVLLGRSLSSPFIAIFFSHWPGRRFNAKHAKLFRESLFKHAGRF